jgi:hypothetical protein
MKVGTEQTRCYSFVLQFILCAVEIARSLMEAIVECVCVYIYIYIYIYKHRNLIKRFIMHEV